MQTQASVEIDRPIKVVFQYTTHNVAVWSQTVIEDTVFEDVNSGAP